MKKEIRDKKIGNSEACLPMDDLRGRSASGGRGFSMIEVIISIFLIIVGIIASVELISKSLKDSMDSRDQLIAVGLAQEGVELVRNVRDNNWLTGLIPIDNFRYIKNGDCRTDINYEYGVDGDIRCFKVDDDFKLYIDSNGLYVHEIVGTSPSRFKRKLIISGSDDSRSIISMVSWGNNGFPLDKTGCSTAKKCVYAETSLSVWGEGAIK